MKQCDKNRRQPTTKGFDMATKGKQKTKKKPAAKKPAPAKSNGADLTAFMVAKLGGEEAVKAAFAKLKFTEAIAAGMSLADIISEGKAGGWFNAIKDTPLGDLLPAGKRKRKGGRKPRAQTAALRESIVKALTKKPVSSKELAETLGESSRSVATQLSKLVSEGLAKRHGSRRHATYSL